MSSNTEQQIRKALAEIVADIPALGPVPVDARSDHSTWRRVGVVLASAACLAALGVGLAAVARGGGTSDDRATNDSGIGGQDQEGAGDVITIEVDEPVERFCNDVAVVYTAGPDVSQPVPLGTLAPDGNWTPAGVNGEIVIDFCRGEVTDRASTYVLPPELGAGTFHFCVEVDHEPSTCAQADVDQSPAAVPANSSTTTEVAEPGDPLPAPADDVAERDVVVEPSAGSTTTSTPTSVP